jgi:hypothetical protein
MIVFLKFLVLKSVRPVLARPFDAHVGRLKTKKARMASGLCQGTGISLKGRRAAGR